MLPIAAPWTTSSLLAEQLVPVPEPLAFALRPGTAGDPGEVAGRAARALLDLPAVAPPPPAWLAPHQVPALIRLRGLIDRYGGALLADAVGLGKSYIALALAVELAGLTPGRRPGVSRSGEPFVLVVPAVLVPQWRRLLEEKGATATIITHESLSRPAVGDRISRSPQPKAPISRSPGLSPGVGKATGLIVVDEAHRFRNPETLRYRRLAALCLGTRVLLVTATPVHNRIADLFHLFRLFLRDDALTALGLGSLARAARGEVDHALLETAAARLIVARSRGRATSVRFPLRAAGTTVRAGAAPDEIVAPLVRGIVALKLGGRAAALLRLALLRRLASSLPAFRSTLARYRTFADLAAEAAHAGRRLDTAEFQRLFPRGDTPDVQLSLLPVLLEVGVANAWSGDGLQQLNALAHGDGDPKADALADLLAANPVKTIVFTEARETARHLLRRLGRRHRVAAVTGASGWFGDSRATPQEVLAAFAPHSQGAPAPPDALATDVLVATDLVSEGLNLQDAARVIHYDLPWSPARLAQRVGRIDRLGSIHDRVETIAFLSPEILAEALQIERRLAAKLLAQHNAGSAQRETPAGADGRPAELDWCDQLQELASEPGNAGWTQVAGRDHAAVLVVRIGAHCDAFVVRDGGVRADPKDATRLLEEAAGAPPLAPDRAALDAFVRVAAPAIRARLAALQTARWRAEDRDRIARRLIPWVLTAGRRAARDGDAPLLRRLDQLVSRLTLGMTAGEELSLHELVERRASLAVRDLMAWHGRLPPVTVPAEAPDIELVAAVVIAP